MENDLLLENVKSEKGLVVKINGEIDIFSSAEFKQDIYKMIQKGEKNIIFDCSNLKYIDSTGLGVFVSILKESKQKDSGIKLINVKSNIFKLFSITGLDRIFDLEKEVI